MFEWLKDHVWLCTYIMLGIAALTFLLNFVFKKRKATKMKTQSIINVKHSSINQADGNITIVKEENER